MQISSNHNLPVIAGLSQQGQPPRGQQQPQNTSSAMTTASAPVESQLINSLTTRVRPAVQAQPLFDQSLTHRGEQARRAYQDASISDEAELLHRLDVRA